MNAVEIFVRRGHGDFLGRGPRGQAVKRDEAFPGPRLRPVAPPIGRRQHFAPFLRGSPFETVVEDKKRHVVHSEIAEPGRGGGGLARAALDARLELELERQDGGGFGEARAVAVILGVDHLEKHLAAFAQGHLIADRKIDLPLFRREP